MWVDEAAQAQRADIPGVDVYSGAEPAVRMALKIDTLQCSVGAERTSAARKSDCSAGTVVQISHMAKSRKTLRLKCDGSTLGLNPGQTIADEVLIRLPFTPEVMQVKMRIVRNRHIGRNITVQATRIR